MSRFRTKARAVDLLGEKQIKDEATAISELFKNAHDADATEAVLSVDTRTQTLILWDDGHGMSLKDVEDKWLTLGSDAKLAPEGPPRRSESGRRVMMGEKGIGRLAIATLGRQMLMITRRLGHSFVLVYIHWDIFTNANLYLEDTVIPVRQVHDLSELERAFSDMKTELERNILDPGGSLRPAWQGPYEKAARRILAEVRGCTPAREVLDPYLNRLLEKGHGTLFYVTNLKEDWAAIGNKGRRGARYERKRESLSVMLANFINTIQLFEGREPGTALQDVYSFTPSLLIDGLPLISPDVFTAEDLNCYDYALIGRVSEGVFRGQALIYGQEPDPVEVDLKHGTDVNTDSDCGPFDIRLYFVEGLAENSRLPKKLHHKITQKLNKIGGIYIYRDGLRVLPYGTPEFDFLELEAQRTKNLGRFMFSLRRLFGYVAISKEHNPGLEDKTSREGLRENEQYYFFRTALLNLLIWWAQEYLADRRTAYMEEQEKRKAAQEEAERQLQQRKKDRAEFLRRLRKAVSEAQAEITRRARALEHEIKGRLIAAGSAPRPPKPGTYFELWDALQTLDRNKALFQQRIDRLDERLVIPADERFALDDEAIRLHRSYEQHLTEQRARLQDLLEAEWARTRERLEGELHRYLDTVARQLHTTSGAAFVQVLTETVERTARNVSATRDEMAAALASELAGRAERYLTQLRDLDRRVKDRQSELTSVYNRRLLELFDRAGGEAEELKALLSRFAALRPDHDLRTLAAEIQNRAASLSQRLSELRREADTLIRQAVAEMSDPLLDSLDRIWTAPEDRRLLGVLEARLLELTSQMEQYRGLVATGLAAEVVNHEFEQQYELVHRLFEKPELRRLKEQFPELGQIETLFRHIETRHRLLSPLYRRTRMHRQRLRIRELAEKTRELFASHLQLYQVDFRNEIEEDFVVYESEPILYPVFINIINNSLYWLLSRKERIILLRSDSARGLLFFEDSGPGISPDKAEKVFELFYTTRIDGRGIGLHLVRELLESRNHTITCVTDGSDKTLGGACFRVQFDPSSNLTGREDE